MKRRARVQPARKRVGPRALQGARCAAATDRVPAQGGGCASPRRLARSTPRRRAHGCKLPAWGQRARPWSAARHGANAERAPTRAPGVRPHTQGGRRVVMPARHAATHSADTRQARSARVAAGAGRKPREPVHTRQPLAGSRSPAPPPGRAGRGPRRLTPRRPRNSRAAPLAHPDARRTLQEPRGPPGVDAERACQDRAIQTPGVTPAAPRKGFPERIEPRASRAQPAPTRRKRPESQRSSAQAARASAHTPTAHRRLAGTARAV